MPESLRPSPAPEQKLEEVIRLTEGYLEHQHKGHPRLDEFRANLQAVVKPMRHFVRQYAEGNEAEDRGEWLARKLNTLITLEHYPYPLQSQIRQVIREAQKEGQIRRLPSRFMEAEKDWKDWIDKNAPKNERETLKASVGKLVGLSRWMVIRVISIGDKAGREHQLVRALHALVERAKLPTDVSLDLTYLLLEAYLPHVFATLNYRPKAGSADDPGSADSPVRGAGSTETATEDVAKEGEQEIDPETLPVSDGPQADTEPTPESPFEDEEDELKIERFARPTMPSFKFAKRDKWAQAAEVIENEGFQPDYIVPEVLGDFSELADLMDGIEFQAVDQAGQLSDGGDNPYNVSMPEPDGEPVIENGYWEATETALKSALEKDVTEPVVTPAEDSGEAWQTDEPLLLTNVVSDAEVQLPPDEPVFETVREAKMTDNDLQKAALYKQEVAVIRFLHQNSGRLWTDDELGEVVDAIQMVVGGHTGTLRFQHLANAMRMQLFDHGHPMVRFEMVRYLHQKEIERNPGKFRSYFDYARSLYANGLLDEAEEQLNKARETKKDDMDDTDRGFVAKANQMEQAIQKWKELPDIIKSATHMKWSADELETVKTAFEKGVFVAAPDSLISLRALAKAFKFQVTGHQNQSIAKELINAAHEADIAANPNDAHAYYLYGEALELQISHRAARQQFEKALQTQCSDMLKGRIAEKIEYLKPFTS